MQPLATTRRVMKRLSMCPADESPTVRHKQAYVPYTIILINLLALIAAVVFIFKYVSIDFSGATIALMTSAGNFGSIYMSITAIQMCHQIGNIFATLSTIYKNHENDAAFCYLERANNTSEWMWTIFKKYVIVTLGGGAAMASVSVLFCYLIRGSFSVDHCYVPIRIVLPWNQTTITGYFGEVIFSILMAYAYFIVNGATLLLFISLCMHHQAFYQMFKHKIDKSEKYDAKLLSDLIQFHISAKDLFLDSANVYRPFVLVQLIYNTVMMTVSTFYFDLQWQQFDFVMFSIMVSASIAMSTLLLYCYFGKLATESYEIMSDRVFKMTWYEQSNELQKPVVLMIANMQKPIYYHGFNVANLDLRTFIKLCNSIFSYYMGIKTLASK